MINKSLFLCYLLLLSVFSIYGNGIHCSDCQKIVSSLISSPSLVHRNSTSISIDRRNACASYSDSTQCEELMETLENIYPSTSIDFLCSNLGLCKKEVAKKPESFKLMAYNVQNCGLKGVKAIADVINSEKPDLLSLEEADYKTKRSKGQDEPAMLRNLTGMNTVFIPSLLHFEGGQYGLVFMSKFPILHVQRIAFPSSTEQRILAVIKIQLDSKVAYVGVTHFDLVDKFKKIQADTCLQHLKQYPASFLFGDLNSLPNDPSIATLNTFFSDSWTRGGDGGPGYSFNAKNPTKRIDYIFLGPAFANSSVKAKVVDAPVQSDHRPITAVISNPWM
eukprot:TRINITY_DN2490_c0_g1_i1.p1 TRINITY_DN2490_c0_g1~~TRINITY_DN2490_c0_g1_i1.p1  ORF type:complete len:334 (-),score=95.08 TRINITY_DN2490_c0_g1_i1:80-1081(-)